MTTGQSGGQHKGDESGAAREQIVAMQWLRGLAASLVVAYHLIERYARRGVFPADAPQWVSRLGEVGVLVFFAISGFIMVYTMIEAPNRRGSARAFLRNRISRIAPLYYLTTILIMGFRLATEAVSTKPGFTVPPLWEWIASFLFIPYRNGEGAFQPIYKLGWTLNYEMFFYLLFAVGLASGRRRLGAWVTIALLCGIVAGGQYLAEPQHNGPGLILYFLSRPILLYFVIGMVLALLHARLRTVRPMLHPAVACILAGVAVTLALVDRPAMSLLWVGVGIVAVTMVRTRISAAPRLSRLAVAFGDASYAMYLTHSFLLGGYAAATAGLAAQGGVVLALLIVAGCGLCFGASWVVWRWVEVPMTRRLRGARAP